MKSFNLLIRACMIVLALTAVAIAQRPRVSDPAAAKDDSVVNEEAVKTVRAKYEGGIFGYNTKQDGTLNLDDANERLLFRNKLNRETVFIPYAAISSAYADTQSRRPTAATVIGSSLPYGLGLPALFIKKKYRYLNIQYRDPDTDTTGIASFKLEDKDLLAQLLQVLAGRAGLSQRGEVFIRKRTPAQTPPPNNP